MVESHGNQLNAPSKVLKTARDLFGAQGARDGDETRRARFKSASAVQLRLERNVWLQERLIALEESDRVQCPGGYDQGRRYPQGPDPQVEELKCIELDEAGAISSFIACQRLVCAGGADSTACCRTGKQRGITRKQCPAPCRQVLSSIAGSGFLKSGAYCRVAPNAPTMFECSKMPAASAWPGP